MIDARDEFAHGKRFRQVIVGPDFKTDDTVNLFRIYLKRGVPMPDVRERILRAYGGKRQVFDNVKTRQHLDFKEP